MCDGGGGRLRKLNNMVQHLILVKRRHFPYPLLLSGSAAKSGQRAGRSGKAVLCALGWGPGLRLDIRFPKFCPFSATFPIPAYPQVTPSPSHMVCF